MYQPILVRLAIGAIVASLLGSFVSEIPAEESRPNVIIINIDDLGYADIGPFGSKKNPTPALTKMAAEGMKLTSHYAAPVCSPSRAALLTGCYPKRVLSIPHVLFPSAGSGLHPDEVTIADMLKASGYKTACLGKWHVGDQAEFLPTKQGFDSYYGIPYSNDMGTATDGSKSNFGAPLPMPGAKGKGKQPAQATGELPLGSPTGLTGNMQPPLPLLENDKVVARVRGEDQVNLTRDYTKRAVNFIRENKDQPFFLYFAHTAVHFPMYPSKEFRTSDRGTLDDWVDEVDASVGEVLAALAEMKIDEKTLVIFTSDNGGSLPHGSDNTPLKGSKGSTWEGGIRVPTIARWPGTIKGGTSTSAITGMIDLLPTIAAATGAKLPERKLDGLNQLPLLNGTAKESPRREFFYFRGLELDAVRRDNWKLHLAKGELYDLESDIGESKNVAADHPEIVKSLTELAATADKDLGQKGIGPGVRPLGTVESPRPLIGRDGTVRADAVGDAKILP